MSTHDYKLWNARELGVLENELRVVLSEWVDRWFRHDLVAEDIRCVANEDMTDEVISSGGECKMFKSGTDLWAALNVNDTIRHALCRQLITDVFEPGREDIYAPIVSKLLERIEFELATILQRSALRNEMPYVNNEKSRELANTALKSGSGSVLVEIAIGEVKMVWVLSMSCVQGWLRHSMTGEEADLPDRIPIVSVGNALASQNITLEINAGGAEITLAQLQALSIGDVIRLDTHLNKPLPIYIDDKYARIGGHLGVQGNNKAIQLTATIE